MRKAFRAPKDVADALARRETLSEQLDAQRQYVAAEQTSLDIALKRYQTGVGDYLSVLTAQRTLWSAQATLISLQQTDLKTASRSGSRWEAAPA